MRRGTSRRQRSRSWSRERDRRDEMDRGWREEDHTRDYHEDRGRPDARDRRPDRGQGDYRDHRGDDSWACGSRSGTDDGRGGAPRPSGGHQFETRYDSQAFQHQPRSEAMAERNSSARRDEPPRRRDEPSLRRDEPQRRYEEPSRHRDEPERRHLDEPSHNRQRDGVLYDSGSRTQERRLPDSSAAPTRRVGTPSSQELGRAPPAPKVAVDGRVLSGQISKAGSTQELLRLSTTHSASHPCSKPVEQAGEAEGRLRAESSGGDAAAAGAHR